jgi:ubiquinone/menaquinone biosynthesis C-methylase UbiE
MNTHAGNGAIGQFYARNSDYQWSRFDTHARIEEHMLRRCTGRYLPSPPATVIDVGGGSGRQAFQLAAAGYDVLLCDITQALLDAARERNERLETPAQLRQIVVADARHLPWEDGCADAAIVLGPMYGLRKAEHRLAALGEACRVLRPGSMVFLQYFQRVAGLRYVLESAPAKVGLFDWREFLRTGLTDEPQMPELLRSHYFATAGAVSYEVAAAGLELMELRGMEGPAPSVGQAKLSSADTPLVEQWTDIAEVVCGQAEHLSTSTHLLAIARTSVDGTKMG